MIVNMDNKEFLKILNNIYSALTYDDWFHAKEYVKLEIDKLEKIIKEDKKLDK